MSPHCDRRNVTRLCLNASLAAGSLMLLACGDETPSAADHRKVADLSAPECQELSTWFEDLAEERLPPAGTVLNCNGKRVPFAWTASDACLIASNCSATVVQLRRCMPSMYDTMPRHMCAFVQDGLEGFRRSMSTLPECRGVELCTQELERRFALRTIATPHWR